MRKENKIVSIIFSKLQWKYHSYEKASFNYRHVTKVSMWLKRKLKDTLRLLRENHKESNLQMLLAL